MLDLRETILCTRGLPQVAEIGHSDLIRGWTRQSIGALAMTSSPNISPRFSKPLFAVSPVDERR